MQTRAQRLPGALCYSVAVIEQTVNGDTGVGRVSSLGRAPLGGNSRSMSTTAHGQRPVKPSNATPKTTKSRKQTLGGSLFYEEEVGYGSATKILPAPNTSPSNTKVRSFASSGTW